MLIILESHTKTLNTQDFRHKTLQFERFYAECTENLGHLMRFFQKIGNIAIFGIKLTSNLTIWVENYEKLDFSVKYVGIY